jgi:hypothetical protein
LLALFLGAQHLLLHAHHRATYRIDRGIRTS